MHDAGDNTNIGGGMGARVPVQDVVDNSNIGGGACPAGIPHQPKIYPLLKKAFARMVREPYNDIPGAVFAE